MLELATRRTAIAVAQTPTKRAAFTMNLRVLPLKSALLLCVLCAVTACVSPRSAQHQRIAIGNASMQGTGGRDDFEAELKSLATRRAADGSDSTRETSGNLKLHIGDDSVVQYWLIIENPNADVFTEAQLRRLSVAQKNPAVAILFADAQTRDRRVQLRGTLAVVKSGSISRLIQEVRMHPDSFYVSVRGDAGAEVMSGRLR
jgi:hypothetical protein